MRRIALAFVLMIVSGWAAPAQAQWWSGGWGRPCFGGCQPWREGGGWAGPRRVIVFGYTPRPTWVGPGAFGPPLFRPDGWGWRRMLWRREMRWRRREAWRRWADAGREAGPPRAERPRVHRWSLPPSYAAAARSTPPRAETDDPVRDDRHRQDGADAVVAMFPTGALHLARPRVRAAMPSRVLAAAAMLRRAAGRPAPVVPAVIRVPEPPARPVHAALRHAVVPLTPSTEVRPAGLRNQPAAPAAPTPVAPEPIGAAPADVPVAPLD